ncbi:MAG TPA: HD domain-containing protein [Gammaproteobacteria bacterium]|nr:HD domain-containing protein [Gammaproteobacteria bacterium]
MADTRYMDSIIRYIFSRPLLTALLVGTSIHLFNQLNLYLASGVLHFRQWQNGIFNHTAYTLIDVLIPFFVPWMVASFGCYLSRFRQQQVMNMFPDSNPDIVMSLDNSGVVQYVNKSCETILKQLGIDRTDAARLLPEHFHTSAHTDRDGHNPATESIRHGQQIFHFRLMRSNQHTLVIGHDISDLYAQHNRLEGVVQQFHNMTEYMDRTLESYDPLHFDADEYDQLIIEKLFSKKAIATNNNPEHVFLLDWKKSKPGGYLYSISNDTVYRREYIELEDDVNRYAIMSGEEEVVFINWEDDADNLQDFQERFHPQVRRHIGIIERYTTYRSGDVAIIAFYRGRRLDHYDAMILKALATFSQSLHRIAEENRETERAFLYTVDALARAAEANDEDTGAHIVRINEYARILAEEMGMDEHFVNVIHYSAQMHDVGKVHVSAEILKKPGKLTDEEFSKMKAHPAYGARILGDSPRLAMAREIALYHHEKYTGKGYPHGLAGDAIPLSARIVALADVYDALRQGRVYKPAFSHEKTVHIITEGDGRTLPDDFDPEVLAAFRRTEKELDHIFHHYV